MAYYSFNRTPHTSHASDVSHGETFFMGRVNLILKEPKSFEEQLTSIKEKGFVIPEGKEQACIEFLQKTNYYRLSAYFLPFRKNDGTFFPEINFSRIQRIYEFDSRLRALIFGIVEDIEVYLRTQIAYYAAHKYGTLGYLEESMFSENHNDAKYLIKIAGCIEENANTLVVKHHKQYYKGKFPLWVIIEFFSVGMLSYFYKDMITEDKKVIATNLYRTSPVQLESWLRCLTDLRNRCAHYSRIYYWSFPAMPKMPNNCDYKADRKLFSQLLMLKFLYPDTNKWYSKFVPALKVLIEEYEEDISLKHIGFPADWKLRLPDELIKGGGGTYS